MEDMVKVFNSFKDRKLNFLSSLNLSVVSFLILTSFYICSRGLEFTDEGYYLQSVAYPYQFQFGVSQFGFLFHPFYNLVGESVVLLRILNVILTISLSLIFCLQVFRSIFPKAIDRKSFVYSSSLSLSVVSLNIFSLGILSPSHNSLNFTFCLLFAIAINYIIKTRDDCPLIVFFLLGVVLSFSFLNKPSTGVLLTFISGLMITILKFRRFGRIFTTAFGGILAFLTSGFLIDGNLFVFIARLAGGMKISQLMGHDFEDMLKIYGFHPNRLDVPILAVAAIILLSAPLVQKRFYVLLILITLGFSAVLILPFVSSNFAGGQFKAIWFAGIPILLILQSVMRKRWSAKLLAINLDKSDILWCFVLFFLPLVFAIGTNNNYWEIGSWVSLFSFTAGYKLYKFGATTEIDLKELVVMLSVSTLLVAYVFLTSVSTPYRQDGNLFFSSTRIEGASWFLEPSVSLETSNTLKALNEIFARVNPEIQKPFSVLDLTGQSPGLIFAAGGKTVGQPWLAGGYPGSESAMRWVINSLTPCQRVSSLILVEERGLRSLATKLLSEGGWHFETDYKSAGHFKIVAGNGFYGEPRRIELFQPSSALLASLPNCSSLRH